MKKTKNVRRARIGKKKSKRTKKSANLIKKARRSVADVEPSPKREQPPWGD